MRRALISLLSMAGAAVCASAQFVTPVPSAMPAWMVPYPGAAAQNRRILNAVEASYTVAVAPHDVLAHFRTLFAAAGLPFEPDPLGGGFLLRAAAPECDLDISIRRRDSDTEVKVTCSPRLAANDQMARLRAQEKAAQAAGDGMKKFDTPVYPQPKAPLPPLTWPSWLVRVDGARLLVEKSPGRLSTSFVSRPTREAIQYFYATLLSSHGYRVAQGLAAAPEKFGSWVQGTGDADDGRRLVIWVKIRPSGQDFAVELSLQ
ncbi:MAG TPA: hypothetical protein VGG72_09415 [Bryobacteraceae bacterium]|jgi:hypothetical protein